MITINKTVLSIALATLAICSTASRAASIDPFIQEWDYSDGINTYKLNITKSNAPAQDYSIYYTIPGGYSTTDMCVLTSNTSFHCLTGETVTRDDAQHAVTLTEKSGTSYTYYDPSHMPPLTTIFGKWNWQNKDQHYAISITQGSNDKEYNVATSSSDGRGNHCEQGTPTAYQVSRQSDGTEIISYQGTSVTYKFKYDPQKKQITNGGTGQEFDAGSCVMFIDDNHAAVFTK